jgi:hypothetical protein
MKGLVLILLAVGLALLLAATIAFIPPGNSAREGIATILTLPLIGVIAVLIGGYRA